MLRTIQTINTLELSSKCNLNCVYCVQPQMKQGNTGREIGLMSEDVFYHALGIISELVAKGTQKEVNVNGNGEATLHPDLCTWIGMVKEVVGPDRPVRFCTNGMTMTKDLAIALKASGVDAVEVSAHKLVEARKALHMLAGAGIRTAMAMGAALTPHDWAGQIESDVPCKNVLPCHPLIEGRGYVQSGGEIVPCCYDAFNKGVIGTVFDEDILIRKVRPYALCDSCDQVIPEDIRKAAVLV